MLLAPERGSDVTPYISSGGYTMPSVGSSLPSAPSPEPRVAVPRTDPTPSFPTVSDVLKGGSSVITNYFKPPATASDVTPSIPTDTGSVPIGGHTVSTGGGTSNSGTPTASSGGSTPVPSTGQDYFHDVLDLITAQLHTGDAAPSQSFSAAPVALPSGGSFAGADSETGSASGSAVSRAVPKLIVLAIVGAGLYYWFVWRKKHRAGGAA